jgi:hypothetical protein
MRSYRLFGGCGFVSDTTSSRIYYFCTSSQIPSPNTSKSIQKIRPLVTHLLNLLLTLALNPDVPRPLPPLLVFPCEQKPRHDTAAQQP